MAYTTIDKPTDYFNTITYSGDGTSPKSITGVGFQPDWVWIKRRNGTTPHVAYDVVRGSGKQLIPNDTSAEATNNTFGFVSDFETDGYEVTQGSTNISRVNGTGGTYVAWNWLADNTSGSSNTDGSISSTVSVNTTAGFSIVKYTGTGSAATVGHGLGSALDMLIVKNRDDSVSWNVWHNALGGDEVIKLDSLDAKVTSSTRWNSTIPTSSVFSVGTANGTNGSSDDLIAYCFAEIKGFSKFGSYEGNGNSNGTFVYTGFKPAWLMVKRYDGTGQWFMFDNKRDGYNSENNRLIADVTNTEADPGQMELLSNGFKWRFTSSNVNGNGADYLYMAFAENPFVSSSGVAGTAR